MLGQEKVRKRPAPPPSCRPATVGVLSAADHYAAWDASCRPSGHGIHFVDAEAEPDGKSWSELLSSTRRLADAVDIPIVSLHWGPKFRWEPSANLVLLGRQLIESGALLVHGHSPHHVQRADLV